MDHLLGQLVIVLLAAVVAAELSERAGLPTVVGEILAGVLVGPSVLGLVHSDELLHVLGELGVLILLLEVGMQMDVREIFSVGRAATFVALTGVVVPFGLGYLAAAAAGLPTPTAIFLGAALTATSVGITARVFGDLRALATVEARTVLGAAVADDVLGLVVLTVVVRIVSGSTVTTGLVVGTIALAFGFLAVVGGTALAAVPRLFAAIESRGRSAGTLVVLALAVAFGVARLASMARLAPIVGAFVAGLALSRAGCADDVRREIRGIGHLLIPVFFLQIGVNVTISELVRPRVLAVAALLMVTAFVGKILAGYVVPAGRGDRLLIGLGMLPRGEVGLIFATIGLQQGVLGADAYAALLVVVLGTTLVTPPLLRMRLLRLRAARHAEQADAKPAGGWLVTTRDTVDLAATPPEHELLHVALAAARQCASVVPGPRLLDWLSNGSDAVIRWDARATAELFDLLRDGDARSWRFVEVTGVLDRALPELAASVRRRRADPADLDPAGAFRWELVDAVRRVAARDPRARLAFGRLAHPEWLLLAALVLEATEDARTAVVVARRLTQRLGLGAAAEQHVAALVRDRDLLPAAAHRPDALGEESILELAVHLGTRDRLDALYVMSVADGTDETWQRGRLDAVAELVAAALRHPELTSRDARNHVEERRSAAARLVPAASAAAQRIATAPRGYVLRQDERALARHAALLDPVPRSGSVRVEATPAGEGTWCIDVASRDLPGLLARVTGGLADTGVQITEAVVATWPDGAALESFVMGADQLPAIADIKGAVENSLARRTQAPGVVGADVRYDDAASPWHTIFEVSAPDRPGLLHSVAAALAAAGLHVHSARVSTEHSTASDVFAVTDSSGEKPDGRAKARFEQALRAGVRPPTRRGRQWAHTFGTSRKHAAHGVETRTS